MVVGASGLLSLELEDVLVLYASLFECSEQAAADQLRYRDGLEMALARPLTYAQYADADVALQAAVLAHGIAETQPFVEGNKRIATLAMLAFLAENAHRLDVSQTELAAWILSLSHGMTEEDLGKRTVLADVQTVVDGLQSMGSIKIPVLSTLWHAVTGKPLTLLDLVAFVVAFPVTVIYRAVEGKWPRNDTALQAAGGGSLLMHRIKNLAGGSAQLIGGILTAIFDLMAGEEDEKRLTIKGKPLVGLRVVGVLGLLGSLTVLIDTAVVSKSDWLKAALSSTVATIVFAVLSPLHGVLTFISIVCQMGAMVEYGEVYHIFEGQPVYDPKQLKLTLSREIIGAAPTLVNWTKYTPEPADLIAPGADIMCRWAAAGIQFTQAIETWNTLPIVAAPTPTPLPSPSPSPSPSPLPESLRRFLPWIRR